MVHFYCNMKKDPIVALLPTELKVFCDFLIKDNR